MLDKKTKDRISKDARTASDARYEGEAQNFEYIEFEDGYKAGAEKETGRAQGLVALLARLRDTTYPISDFKEEIIEVLSKYNNPA